MDTRTVLLLFLCVAVIAVAGTGLFVSRSRATEEPTPTPEPIEAPEPIYPADPTPAPEPIQKPEPIRKPEPIQKPNPVQKPGPIQARTPASSAGVSEAAQPAAPEPAAPRSSAVDAPREPVVTPKTGTLIVTSRPMGAHVSFDGRLVGETPIIVTDVTPGEHRIELKLDGNGYQPWSSSVVVAAGREEKLLAVLTPTGRGR